MVAGAGIAGGIAMVAGRGGSLAPSGRWAALLVGTVATMAGWAWAALLVGWFIASSALTRLGHVQKTSRTAGVLAPSGARTATQVGANGGLFAIAALVGTLSADPRASVLALGALAAAAADTWATEIGLLYGGAPRALFGGASVEAGMSGGVTTVGLAASAAGALVVAVAGAWLVPSAPASGIVVAVATGGVLGALADSVLGGTLQVKQWCAACQRFTERPMHDCGTRTTYAHGLRWMTNDTVNLLATIVGALVASAIFGPLS